MRKRLLFCSLTLVGGIAAAQPTARPDPADPKAAGSPRPYQSAFKDYRPYVEQEPGRWREANDEIGRLGGHPGHARKEAGALAKPAAKPHAHGDRK